MNPSAVVPPRSPLGSERSQQWEFDASAHQRVADLLSGLPPGFVVFHDLQLPKPSRATIDHLVIGPRNIWAVTTHVLSDPVTYGRGRNADTLWSGRTPLRTMLEAADWESSAIGDLIGFSVEPVLCLVAPELPEVAFDFHGIRISEPAVLVRQVATSTADFVDVANVADAVRRTFGAVPSSATVLPTLGAGVVSPIVRSHSRVRRRRSLGAWRHVIGSVRAVRVGALVALVAVLVALLPTIVDLWTSVATEGADRLTDVIDENATTDGSPDDRLDDTRDGTRADARIDPTAPDPVGYVVTCPTSGSGWMVTWSWPGELPPGVAGYAVRTQTKQAPPITHTLVPWNDPDAPPASIRVSDGAATTIFTDHRAADGSVLATTSEQLIVRGSTC